MTIDEVQQMCDDHDVAVGYLGWATRSAARHVRTYACTIQPAQSSKRWRPQEFFIRGKGPTMVAALEDAAAQLASFLLTYERSD